MNKTKDVTAKPVREQPDLILAVENPEHDDPAHLRVRDEFSPEALLRAEEEARRRQTSPPQPTPAPTPTPPRAPERSHVASTVRVTSARGKKTIYPSTAGYEYLRRLRRTQKLAMAFVAEYALDRMFDALDNEEIAKPLRALGHGRRRSRTGKDAREPITVYPSLIACDRLDALYEEHRLAAGIVGGHAVDWLAANETEAATVAALRARGAGLQRAKESTA